MKDKYTTIKCEKCGKIHDVLSTTLYKRKYKNRPNYCPDCMKLYSKEKLKNTFKNKTKEEKEFALRGLNNYRNNLSDEERVINNKINSDKQKERWARMSEDTRNMHLDKLHNGRDNYFENRSDDEIERMSKIISKNSKEYWSKFTKEEKTEKMKPLVELSMKAYYNLSEEEKINRFKNLREGHRLYRNNMSEEDRLKYSEFHRKQQKEFWDNLSEDEYNSMKSKISKGQKDRISNMNEYELKEHNDRLHANHMKWRESLSPEEVELLLQPARLGFKLWNENISQEEKDNLLSRRIEGYKIWWDSLSDQEKDDHIKRLHDGFDQWFESLSEEEKKLRLEKSNTNLKDWFNTLSSEEKEQHYRTITMNANKNKSFTESESIFDRILQENNFRFDIQYMSECIHPDFHKMFPKNPFTNSEFVSPYHSWDFIIYLQDKSILIDIDGSIHDSSKTNSSVLYGKNTFLNLSEFIQFNDSQRPYQTDGLDAYIIKAYNDKIEDDTIVQNVKTNECIKFKDFINIISFDNLSEKDKKELITKKGELK